MAFAPVTVRYPKAQGSYGLIECSALLLDGPHLRVVQDNEQGQSETFFLSYDGRFLRPAGTRLAADAHLDIDELTISPPDGHALGAGREIDGAPLLVGGGEELALFADERHLSVANGQGVFLAYASDQRSGWQALGQKELGRRIILATVAYILGEGEEAATVAWTTSPRSRPSALAERLATA